MSSPPRVELPEHVGGWAGNPAYGLLEYHVETTPRTPVTEWKWSRWYTADRAARLRALAAPMPRATFYKSN